MSITLPSIVDALPDDVYHADPIPGGSLSSTGARILAKEPPARFDYWRRTAQPPKKTFDLGHAVHSLALGYGLGIAVIPEEALSKSGTIGTKDARKFIEQAHADGLVPMKAAEAATAQQMADQLLMHPTAGPLLSGAGKPEQSLFWRDPATGVACRARIDWLPPVGKSGRIINCDLKTARDASADGFAKAIGEHGYHQQAAHYEDGLLALTGAETAASVWVVIESTAPYLVAVHQAPIVDLGRGRALNDRARRLYAACTASGVWPGYPTGVQMTAVPTYTARTEEELLEEGEQAA